MWFSTISRLFSPICADSFSASPLIVISDKSCVATTFARLSVVVIEELELSIWFLPIYIYIYRPRVIYIYFIAFMASKVLYPIVHGSRIVQLFSILLRIRDELQL
jgi:hypothetical protein